MFVGMKTDKLKGKKGVFSARNTTAVTLAPTNELLTLETLLQPLRGHDVPHHRDGRQELHRACHFAGDEVCALLRRLGDLTAKDVELLKGGAQSRDERGTDGGPVHTLSSRPQTPQPSTSSP